MSTNIEDASNTDQHARKRARSDDDPTKSKARRVIFLAQESDSGSAADDSALLNPI